MVTTMLVMGTAICLFISGLYTVAAEGDVRDVRGYVCFMWAISAALVIIEFISSFIH